MSEFASIRKDYQNDIIPEKEIPKDPLIMIKAWLDDAIGANADEPTAMVLSTAGEANQPSSRVVLLKDISRKGLVFFTNYESRKAMELEKNPLAAALFFWPSMEKQIRIQGRVRRTEAEFSDRYFHSRPDPSKVSSIISPQSREIDSYQVLEKERDDYLKENLNHKRPDYWGGYFLEPFYYEFWQGRPDRLHQRIVFEQSENVWIRRYLAP